MDIKKTLMGVFMSVFALVLFAGVAAASSHLLAPFTQIELDTNWEADRQIPSGGVTSVSAFGRDHVARIGIDSTNFQDGTFYRTEGIKTTPVQNFGDEVQVDLYLDPDWEDKAVRAGFWVVGDNGFGARDNYFGIIEFVHLVTSTSGASAQGDHEGWRIWDSTDGWTNLTTAIAYGEWVTLTIKLDTTFGQYEYYINDESVGTASGGSSHIRELFLNSYNYGEDVFPNLSNSSYAAHWHVGLEVTNPVTMDECKKGGWESFGFKNQGQCIRFVNTGFDSR